MELGYVYITSALNATIVGHMLNEDALTGIANFGSVIINPVYFVYPKGGSYIICASVTCVNLDHSRMNKLKKVRTAFSDLFMNSKLYSVIETTNVAPVVSQSARRFSSMIL